LEFGIWRRRTPNHTKEPYVKRRIKKFRDIYSPNIKLFQKFSEARGDFLKRKSKIVLMRCVPLRIPKFNSNNPTFSKLPERFFTSPPFFSDGIKVEKVRALI
jgi:hypothetical protein